MENLKVYVAVNMATKQIRVFNSQEEVEQEQGFTVFAILTCELTVRVITGLLAGYDEERMKSHFNFLYKYIYFMASRNEEVSILRSIGQFADRAAADITLDFVEVKDVAVEKTNAATF